MERAIISEFTDICAHYGDPSVLVDIGDDCAVIAPTRGLDLIVTTDTLVEGIHFDLSYFDPFHLGRKTAGVNLSDIAAMGGTPRWAFLSIAIPRKMEHKRRFARKFGMGLASKLSDHGAGLVGGDTVGARDAMAVTLTLIGESRPQRALLRSAARAGDLIYCSGYLGEAAAGLLLLKHMFRQKAGRLGPYPRSTRHLLSRSAKQRLIARHLDPEPRIDLGKALADSGLVRCCIDISDGVATDLAHVCEESQVGAVIYYEAIPVSRAMASGFRFLRSQGHMEGGLSPVHLALTGGEDFELLWTVPQAHATRVEALAARILGRRPFCIGKITPGSRVMLKERFGTRDVTFKGYEH